MTSDFLKEHFNTGLKLYGKWKISRYLGDGNTAWKDRNDINSRSQIQVEKGKSIIRMNDVDGRLGGGYNITVNTRYGNLYLHFKRYDEGLDNVHTLMRMIK